MILLCISSNNCNVSALFSMYLLRHDCISVYCISTDDDLSVSPGTLLQHYTVAGVAVNNRDRQNNNKMVQY